MVYNLNPIKINPEETATCVYGMRKDITNDQVYRMELTKGVDIPGGVYLACFGLTWIYGSVKPGWLEDAKRLLAVMKKAVEVGLIPKVLYYQLINRVATTVFESYRDQEAFTEDIRKREAEVEAKHGIKDGYSEWSGVGEGPPEWQDIQAEISENFEEIYFDTLKDLDVEMCDLFKRNGWGYGAEELDAFSVYGSRFFDGEEIL